VLNRGGDPIRNVAVEPVGRGLSIRSLTAGYGSNPIVFDVSLDFSLGSVTAMLGPNGAGKSTLLKAMFGLAKRFDGAVFVNGSIVGQTGRELVSRGVSYVPQLANVFPSLTVSENLEIGTFVRKGHSISETLSIFPELGTLLERRAGKLSGGQRRMVAIARALLSGPEILLLDEATSGLAPSVAQTLWERMHRLGEQGVAVIAVEQNAEMALKEARDIVVLSSGRIVFHGPARNVTVEVLDRAFLGLQPDNEAEHAETGIS
jgi:neutral amino acid transport system ATP-binding protein